MSHEGKNDLNHCNIMLQTREQYIDVRLQGSFRRGIIRLIPNAVVHVLFVCHQRIVIENAISYSFNHKLGRTVFARYDYNASIIEVFSFTR